MSESYAAQYGLTTGLGENLHSVSIAQETVT